VHNISILKNAIFKKFQSIYFQKKRSKCKSAETVQKIRDVLPLKRNLNLEYVKLTLDVIRPSSGIVIVCTKLPLIISRISMESCVNASTYGKAHTENKLYIYHITIVLKLYQNSISMMLKLEAMNCTQNGAICSAICGTETTYPFGEPKCIRLFRGFLVLDLWLYV
jgi:hypothetical protein